MDFGSMLADFASVLVPQLLPVRKYANERGDNELYNRDMQGIQTDPAYKPDYSGYNNAQDAVKGLEAFRTDQYSRLAAPTLSENNALMQEYRQKAGQPYSGADAQPGDTYPTLQEFASDPSHYMDFGKDPQNNPSVQAGNKELTGKISSAAVYDSLQNGQKIDPYQAADLMGNEKLTQALHQLAQGGKQLQDTRSDAAKAGREADQFTSGNDLNKFVAAYPLKRDVGSWNGLAEGLRLIPNLDPKLVDSTLKDIAGRNEGPTGTPLSLFARSGDATTNGSVSVDMFGKPIPATEVKVTNHPKAVGGGGGRQAPSDSDSVDVSWLFNGAPQSASIARGDLPGFQSSLQAQGVKDVTVLDGKRAVKKNVLIAPDKKGAAGGFAAMVAGSGKPAVAEAIKPSGSDTDGKAYYTWTDGTHHYNPQGK